MRTIVEYMMQASDFHLLNEYLSTKVKQKTKDITNDFFLVYSYVMNKLYAELNYEYEDNKVVTPNGGVPMFILDKDIAIRYKKKGATVYLIPSGYLNVDKVANDFNDGKIDVNKLEELSSIDEYMMQASDFHSAMMNEYLSTKINKDKIFRGFSDDYCIVDPINDTFTDFLEKYKDNIILLRSGLRIFVLTKKEAAKYIDNEDVAFFEIPDKFKDIEYLIQSIKNEEYDIDDFKELSLNELNTYK